MEFHWRMIIGWNDEWWLLFLSLFRWLDIDWDLLLPLECFDVDDRSFVVVGDSLSLWLWRLCRVGERSLEWWIVPWFFSDIDCIFREDRGVILAIGCDELDEERYRLFPLIVGNVVDCMFCMLDHRWLGGVKLEVLLIVLLLCLVEYGLFLMIEIIRIYHLDGAGCQLLSMPTIFLHL